MRNFLTLTLIGFASQKALIPENQYDVCLTKLDRGHTNCQNPQNQIRFYFDEQLENCFAYLYEGCDGGRNTFYTEHQCLLTCIPADKHTCGGNMIPTGSCHNMDLTCPFGSTCLRGAHGAGLCCDDVNEDEWLKELTPLCRIGKVLTRHMWYGERVWIGRNCSHRFCPHGYDCFQGKRIAHCCGPNPNFKEKLYEEVYRINKGVKIAKKTRKHCTDSSSSSSSSEEQ